MIGIKNLKLFSLLIIILLFSSNETYSLTIKEAKLLTEALRNIDNKKLLNAKRKLNQIQNPLAKKYLTWELFQRTNNPQDFFSITNFLMRNEDWPNRINLKHRIEYISQFNVSSTQILNWFEINHPMTRYGRTRLITEFLRLGKINEAKKLIKKIWVEENFFKTEERVFYKRFRKFLSRESHVKRLDRLLWDGKFWASRRMLPKVSNDWKSLAEARYSLRRRTGNVDTLIKKVPDALKGHPGLVYERIRWRRRKGLDTANTILNNFVGEMVRADLWWTERIILARNALRKGLIADSLRFTSQHGLLSGIHFAEAEWMSGWINLKFLKKGKVALSHFERMYSSVKYPISRARGAYWAARAAEMMGNKKLASRWFFQAATFKTTFYGQLAISKINLKNRVLFRNDPKPKNSDIIKFNDNELVKVVVMLNKIERNDRSRPFIKRLFELEQTAVGRLLTAKLAKSYGLPDLSIWVSKRSSRNGSNLINIGYPIVSIPRLNPNFKLFEPEKALVLAMIRQESAFRSDSISTASARGLMQLMPSTARRVAKSLKTPYSRKRLTEDSNYNMLLGQAYLSKVLLRYQNSYVLALAAYNAGPKHVRNWVRQFGDPRSKEVDSIDWIEMIPFKETRNYVQRVLENLQVYRHRLKNKKVSLTIWDDLHLE